MNLTKRETATVLAALRNWQKDISLYDALDLMPSHFGEDTPLDLKEIDTLCERINCEEDRARALLQDLVEAFPEFETDEPIVGSSAVDILSAFYKRAQIILGDSK